MALALVSAASKCHIESSVVWQSSHLLKLSGGVRFLGRGRLLHIKEICATDKITRCARQANAQAAYLVILIVGGVAGWLYNYSASKFEESQCNDNRLQGQ